MDKRRRLIDLESRVLRLDDRESIRDLVYEYQRLCDGGWAGPSHLDPVALKRLFTLEGEYQIDPTRPPNKGHEAIEKAFVRLQNSMPWIIHYATNPLIEVDGDTAEVRVQGFALYKRAGADHIAMGSYRGKAVRTNDGWRFASWIFDLAHSRPL
ncbi:MAG: nuclear transport factor 2 family protein [Ilumatobacteraceae bacterium]